ncbi:MAG: PAS domain-containing protein, partial [Gammaproteobacteria bacterium]|nr:PAS domain-containing protein [Gammaproteobacteria bacterium]
MSHALHMRRSEYIAAALAALSFALGLAAQHITPASGLGAALFLVALLFIGRLPDRGVVLAGALACSIATLAPRAWLWATTNAPAIDLATVIWCALYWMAAASLTWDPRRRQVGMRQLADAFAHAPAPMALADRMGVVLDANDAFADLTGLRRATG